MQDKVQMGARLLLGLILVVFGANKFIGFLPPPEMAGQAGAFMGALIATGYLMPVVAIVEVLTGLMLLANRNVPLALVLLAPISLNIIMFHLFLDIASIPVALFVFAVNLYLLIVNKSAYAGILETNTAAEKVMQ